MLGVFVKLRFPQGGKREEMDEMAEIKSRYKVLVEKYIGPGLTVQEREDLDPA